jgi:phosphonate transport system substrate-binding protein
MMKAKIRWMLIAGMVMLLATLLVGCGTKTEGAGTTADSTVAETSVPAGWPEKLVMGFLPNEESTPENRTSNKIHQQALSDYLGIPVEVIIAEDYNAVIETMRNDKTHLAHFGPFAYIIAHDRSNAEAIVVSAKEGKKERAFYSSLIVTHSSSKIEKLEDIKGKSMAFVDPASASGNLVPRAMFVKEFNLKPAEIDTKLFSSVQFSGSHNNSLLAVANKSVDVAAMTRMTYENGIKNNVVKEADLRIIAESDPIPNSPIAVRGDLPADLKAKIKEFYLQWQDAAYLELRNIVGNRYVEVKDSDYDSLRDIAKQMEMRPEELLK